MNNKNPHVEQKAEGRGIAQAAGERATAITIFGIPIEGVLTALLITSIIFECIAFMCASVSRGGNSAFLAPLGYFCICTAIFGPLALYSLIMGIMQKNNKIVALSLISGAFPFFTVFLIAVLCNLFSIGCY